MIRLIDVYQGTGVTPGAIEFLYELIAQRMTEPEVNISATMPTLEQHRQFVHRRPYRYWYLVQAEHPHLPGYGAPWWVGYISATERNEIGIVLLKEWRGRGLGAEAVRAFVAKHRPNPAVPSEVIGYWLANIAPYNERSKQMFQKLGFEKISETYALEEEPDAQETRPTASA